MNLNDLYAATPAARHGDIRVIGDHVFLRDADGDLLEFLINPDGDLWQKPAAKTFTVELAAIKTALANARTVINAIRTDVTAIKTKVGA
jgi:hypothetical protein